MFDPLFGCYVAIIRRSREKVKTHAKLLKHLRLQQAMTSELFSSAKSRELAEQIASEEEQIVHAINVFNDAYELLTAWED